RDFESERSHQSSMIEENSTVGAASNPDDWTTITGGKLLWVFGKVGTGNEIVHQPQQLMCRIIVNLIDIDKDRDSRFACPTRRLESSCRVAAVQMKHFCARDQLAVHLPNWVLKCRIAPPQNCSFADTLFNENDRDLTAGSLDFANVQLQFFVAKTRQLCLPPA